MASRRLLAVCLVLLALAPSAYLAWEWRAMEQLGLYHDDTLYLVSAKSLAEGNGYRIESFPGQPAQTKYPPALPFLLSLIWRISPNFPQNLPLVMLACWLALPLSLAASALYFRNLGFDPSRTALLCACLALSPMVAAFSVVLMAEVLFAAFLVLTLVLAERAALPEQRVWLAAAAGLFGAAAFLTKSAGLPLLVTVPLCLLFQRQARKAMVFVGVMLPPVAAWQIWKSANMSKASDLVTLYYVNYQGFYLKNVEWRDLPSIVATDAAAVFTAIGKVLLYCDDSSLGILSLSRILAVASLAGAIQIARRGKLQFPAFAAAYAAILLIWHYPPDSRFLMPLAPLLLAGLAHEFGRVANAIRTSWKRRHISTKVAAMAFGTGLAALAGVWCYQAHSGLRHMIPAVFEQQARRLAENQAAYRWIRENTASGDQFFADQDPVLYLYTGRRAASLRPPPILFFRDDRQGVVDFMRSLPDYAREFRLSYALLTPLDFNLFMPEVSREGIRQLLDDDVLEPRYASGAVRVFSLPAPAVTERATGLPPLGSR